MICASPSRRANDPDPAGAPSETSSVRAPFPDPSR